MADDDVIKQNLQMKLRVSEEANKLLLEYLKKANQTHILKHSKKTSL